MMYHKNAKTFDILRKVRYKLPSYLLRILYNTMVLTYPEYCNVVWSANYPACLDRLIKLQKKIIRLINRSHRNEHSLRIFEY